MSAPREAKPSEGPKGPWARDDREADARTRGGRRRYKEAEV